MHYSVLGTVHLESDAKALIEDLLKVGFEKSEISILFPIKGGIDEAAHVHEANLLPAQPGSANADGLLSVSKNLGAGVGALFVHGVGPYFATGHLMRVLSGASFETVPGGLSGVLIKMGASEQSAGVYEGAMRDECILIAARNYKQSLLRPAIECFETQRALNVECITDDTLN